MELNQGEIIQKPKMQELSSLFMTHRLIVMYAPVKFHEYIPSGFGVMARTRKWDVRTDGRTERTGVTINPFRYSSNRRGHKKTKTVVCPPL